MKIEYILKENDQLTHQLFLASQSKQVKKRRAKGKFFLLLIYMATGLYIWNRNGVTTSAIFFLICLPLYFIYSYMEKKQYVKYFGNFIREHYSDRLNEKTTVQFQDDRIELSDSVNENVIPVTELEALYEIRELISVSLKNGQSFFIPKSGQDYQSDPIPFLRQLAEQKEIPFIQDLNWKWK